MSRHIPFLFLNPDELSQNVLSAENFHHLIKVLRLKKDDLFSGADNLGNQFDCHLDDVTKNSVSFHIRKQEKFAKSALKMILVQALTKLETFEEIIDKAVQLGISSIVPLITENTTVSPDIFRKKIPRFNKISKTAAEQCRRIYLPELNDLLTFRQFFETAETNTTLVAYEKSETPMKEILKGYSENTISLVCGPEGGFNKEEINYLTEKGFKLISLSKNILRAETAVTAGLSNIVYEFAGKI
jgi:16S rRNA (uracil1498-N3)-methyltransferase